MFRLYSLSSPLVQVYTFLLVLALFWGILLHFDYFNMFSFQYLHLSFYTFYLFLEEDQLIFIVIQLFDWIAILLILCQLFPKCKSFVNTIHWGI